MDAWPSTAPLREKIGVLMAGSYYDLRVFAAMLWHVGAITKDQYEELKNLMELPQNMTVAEVLEQLESSPPARDMPDQPS